MLDFDGLEQLEAYYSYVGNVNRVSGDLPAVPEIDVLDGNARMDSHLVNACYGIEGVGRASGYLYYIDCENIPVFSTSTAGIRFTGDQERIGYTAEGAYQTDIANNPNQVSQPYLHAEFRARISKVTTSVGYELLGGSGDPGNRFLTPFGRLHKFNGWADRFVLTPDRGLQDVHARVTGRAGPDDRLGWLAAVHGFWADATGAHYGNELDLRVSYRITKELTTSLKAAFFAADDAQFADHTRMWLTASVDL